MKPRNTKICRMFRVSEKDEKDGVAYYSRLKEELEDKGYTAVARVVGEMADDEAKHLGHVQEFESKFLCKREVKKHRKVKKRRGKKKKRKKRRTRMPTRESELEKYSKKLYMTD